MQLMFSPTPGSCLDWEVSTMVNAWSVITNCAEGLTVSNNYTDSSNLMIVNSMSACGTVAW